MALRHPLLRFVAIGAALFAVQFLSPEAPEQIILGPSEIAQARMHWREQTGRWPDAESLNALLEHRADEERLLREALRLGLEQDDIVVHRRIRQNFDLLDLPMPASRAALIEQAKRLGMLQGDLVLRRRLAQRMRDLIASRTRTGALVTTPAEWAAEKRYLVDQVWFQPGTTAEHIGEARIELERGAAPDSLGNAFLLGDRLGPWTHEQFEHQLGRAFAEALATNRPGRWSEPVASIYGTHLVRISEQAEKAANPDANRTGLAYRYFERAEQAAIRAALDHLRRRYPLMLAASAEPAL